MIEPPQDLTHGFQLPTLPPSVLHHFVQRGHSQCYAAFYSAKSNEILTGVLVKALTYSLPSNSCADMLHFREKANVLSPEVQQHFIDGAPTLISREALRPMHGTYLVFATPVTSDDPESESRAFLAIENCAAIAALFHGEFVATERHFAAVYKIDIGETIVTSPGLYIRQTLADESFNQQIAKLIDETSDIDLVDNAVATSLLRKAHHERDPSIKFLFLWLALEATLGDGTARRRFCSETMHSEYLNDLINELRTKRDAMVHDGRLPELDLREFISLKCIIIMGLSNNQPLRDRLLSYLSSAAFSKDPR